MNYWQSKNGQEVDFIIGDAIALEVKATSKINDKHFKGLHALAEESICKKYYLISQDSINRKYNSVEALYWKDFLINCGMMSFYRSFKLKYRKYVTMNLLIICTYHKKITIH